MSLCDWNIQEEWQRDIDRANRLNELHGCKTSAQAYVRAWKHLLGCEVEYDGDVYYIIGVESSEHPKDNPVVNVRTPDNTQGYRIFADRLIFINDMDQRITFNAYIDSYWSMR